MLHLDYDWLLDKHDSGLSQREIAKLAGVSTPTIRSSFKKFGIKPRSISSALKIKPSKHVWTDEERQLHSEKMKDVVAPQKEKKSERLKERWINDRDRLISDIKAAMTPERREAASKKSLELWQDDRYRQLVCEKLAIVRNSIEYRQKLSIAGAISAQRQPKISSLSYRLYDYLDILNIAYIKEGPGTVIGYYQFDCLIPKTNGHKNILIECQGDYWHSLPKAEIRDRQKFSYINRYFPDHEIMYLWEHEFSQRDGVIDRLKFKLGLEVATANFAFSDVVIQTIAAKEATDFLNKYHYIGKSRGGKCYGAYLDGMLVAVSVFSPPLRQNMKDCVELSRFCIHPKYHKKNFASWFISKVVRNFKNVDIVAFADSTVGHVGTIYKALGFKHVSTVPSDYWYVSGDGFVMHKKTLYNRAVSLAMSESEFARTKNYSRVYGGPKLKFVLVQ